MPTVTRNSDGTITMVVEKLGPGRFPVMLDHLILAACEEVKAKDGKGSTLASSFATPLGQRPDTKIVEIKFVSVKDGGTQSKCFLLKLENASFFIKVLAKGSSDAREQSEADKLVKKHLDPAESPFITASAYLTIKIGLANKKPDSIDVIIYPFVNAHQIIKETDAQKRAVHLGKVLGSVYVNQLKKEGRLAELDKNSGLLSKVLVHEDFQMSNVLIQEDGKKRFLVDIGGLHLSTNATSAYRNLCEAIEMVEDKDDRKTLIETFVKQFKSYETKVLRALIENARAALPKRSAELESIGSELASQLTG